MLHFTHRYVQFENHNDTAQSFHSNLTFNFSQFFSFYINLNKLNERKLFIYRGEHIDICRLGDWNPLFVMLKLNHLSDSNTRLKIHRRNN